MTVRPALPTLNSRWLVAGIALALVVMALPASAQSHARGARLDRVEHAVIAKINSIRASHGLHGLRAIAALGRSADFHSRDMLRANFFAHTSSNGQSFSQRVESFRPSKRIGETLAYVPKRARGQARRIVAMWMNSAPHRASLLSASFRRIGVARRRGKLGGTAVTVFTADFASKR